MRTEAKREGAERGFTLIEVLVAMVILAVGLLGLEALGIGAARAVNRAERQSEFTVVASDTLERVLNRIREGQAVPSQSSFTTSSHQDTVRIAVTREPATGNPALFTVAVTVVPNPAASHVTRADSFRIESSTYVP